MHQWQEIHRRFDALRPAEWLHPQVLAFLRDAPSSRPLLVACSGGPDSVFLTLALCSLFAKDLQRLRLCHFNHGLRGAESDADEGFVRQIANELEIPFEAGRPEQPLQADEASLRAARYAWLDTLYQRHGAAAIALGQHADDLLESMLMGLFTGSGPSGLASPMPVRRFADGHVRIRPLLGIKREQIVRSLGGLEIPWREDPSNADTAYTRNWIRAELIPLLRDHFPQDIHAGVLRTRSLMEEHLDFVDAAVRNLEIDNSDPELIEIEHLKENSPALIRRLLMGWWLRHYPDSRLPKDAADQAVRAILSGDPAVIPIGRIQDEYRVLELADGRLRMRSERPSNQPFWAAGAHWHVAAGELFLPDGAVLSGAVESVATGKPYLDAEPEREAWLSGVDGPLFVRQWQAGDRYRPLGAPGSRKLQNLFTDAKIPSEQKYRLPVILDAAGDILWVPGFPPADARKVCHNVNSALKLTYFPQ